MKNKKNKVVEICCGIGGTRKAFLDSGFNVVQSIDNDEIVCDFHKKFWGDVTKLDINQCSWNEIESGNILSAGFPCQPFSSSGYRTGFTHIQGNVFSSLINLIEKKNYDVVFLENVKGLLSNDNNRTFKIIISELAKRYKIVEWLTFNLLSLEIPMNRPRLIILAHNLENEVLSKLREKFFYPINQSLFSDEKKWNYNNIQNDNTPNQLTGRVITGNYILENYVEKDISYKENLMEFLFGDKIGDFNINSGRFWGRTGKTTFYISNNGFSHSIGTSMGGAPTFAFCPSHLNKKVLEKVQSISNYQTEHSGFFVFRIKPEESLKFFGERALIFHNHLKHFGSSLASKYKLIGNMFAPDQAFEVLKKLSNVIIKS